MNRRNFITGLSGILVASQAPAIIATPGLLMPIRVLSNDAFFLPYVAGRTDQWAADVKYFEAEITRVCSILPHAFNLIKFSDGTYTYLTGAPIP